MNSSHKTLFPFRSYKKSVRARVINRREDDLKHVRSYIVHD